MDDGLQVAPAHDGCDHCRSWTDGEPHRVATSTVHQGDLYRCGYCGTYWLNDPWAYPSIIDDALALEILAEPQPMTWRELAEGIEPLAARAGVRLGDHEVVTEGGLPQLRVMTEGGLYAVYSNQQRVAWGMRLPVLQKYLASAISGDVRNGELPNGYDMQANEDGVLLVHAAQTIAAFPAHSRDDAVRLAQLNDLDIGEVVRLLMEL